MNDALALSGLTKTFGAKRAVDDLSLSVRAGELYAPTHPLVQRSIDALFAVTTKNLQNDQSAVVGFLGNDIVVNDLRLGKFSAQLVGLVRDITALRAAAIPDDAEPAQPFVPFRADA